MSVDEHDLAAERLLSHLLESGGVEFVSSRGAAALAGAAAHLLLRIDDDPQRARRFADWLIDQVEVADLFVDNDELERLLVEDWDRSEASRLGPTVARNPELEARLLERADELEPYLVYGDWLQAQGDIYGEWIARQIAAHRPDAPRALAVEAAAWLHANAPALLGPLAEYLEVAVHLDWHLGFVRRARVGRHANDGDSYEGAILLEWLLEQRACLLLRELEIESLERGRSNQLVEMIQVLARSAPRTLRRLSIAQGEAGELAPLLEALPELHELEVRTDLLRMQPLAHAQLRRLEINLGWPVETAAQLLRSRLPALESLALVGHRTLDVEQLGTLASPPLFPRLRALRMRSDAALLEQLAASLLLKQLERLDLTGGNLDDEAIAAVLLPQRDRFKHLRTLVLDDNTLTAEVAGRVVQALPGVDVVIGTQRPSNDNLDDDDEYYEDSME